MCGIAGVFHSLGVVSDPERTALARMLEALRHRGPDGEGTHEDGSVLLGHRRLAIIDLSDAARQPMPNETKDVWLTFNGEIYNFVELRDELRAGGHVFRSRTDSEVVVHGYEAWGIEGLLSRLSGMFAFALWDSRARTLYLARDRFGIKPLYYGRSADRFVFASELRALAASGLLRVEPSRASCASFLAFGSIPAPDTALAEMSSMRPGHYLEVSSRGEREKRWWTIPVGERPEGRADVARLLRDSVRAHLVSDVPLGVFLSGGIDSAALVATASRFVDEPLTALSVVLDDPELDESVYARAVAQKYGTAHREVRVGASSILEALPRFFGAMDQPTVDGVNSYVVSRAAREAGLTVVLTGLGGDEVFLGYPHFRKIRTLGRWMPLVRAPLLALRRFRPKLEYLRDATPTAAYSVFRGLYAPSEIEELLPGAAPAPLSTRQEDFLDAAIELELERYLHDQLLRDTDSMSMAHSIEARVPFLDPALVEAVLRLPPDAKLKRGVNKPLLLESIDDPLPREIWDRPKQGFTLPFARFLREHHLELEARTLDAAPFAPDAVRRVWRSFLDGRVHWSRPWALVAYSSWREGISELRIPEPAVLTIRA
jgi:asparagine synthase (glutamine-hydrolysing)